VQNPVFSSSAVFGEKADRSVTRTDNALRAQASYPGLQQPVGAPPVGVQPTAYAPAANRTMTYEDVIVRTAGVFAVLLLAGVVGWHYGLRYPALIWVGLLGGLVLGLVNAFKKVPSPGLILVYGAFEGLFLGAISAFYDYAWNGIALQAVLATAATFVASLLLFRSGKVRVTPKFTRWLVVAISGYAIFSLVNLVLVWTGVLDGWGMRNGGFGVLIGLFAVGLAAASLIVDFDSIARGVRGGAPVRFAWSAAFGLVVTLVWLYLEFLRLLAILRR